MAKKTSFQYPGKKATVSWNGRLCIHVAECGRAKGDLFVGGRDPWCRPDLATDEEVADVIHRCPTGAGGTVSGIRRSGPARRGPSARGGNGGQSRDARGYGLLTPA